MYRIEEISLEDAEFRVKVAKERLQELEVENSKHSQFNVEREIYIRLQMQQIKHAEEYLKDRINDLFKPL